MSRIYWIFTSAIVLTLLSPQGQAQEKAQNSQRQTTQEQKPTQTLPIPLPVDIVVDKASADARERREAETRQHEIDDLAAQQGMNLATQAMNEATQRMAFYSLISTFFVGIGTILLFYTLWLTRQANRVAQSAVDVTDVIGKRQLRAYISVLPLNVTGVNVGEVPKAEFQISNDGQTPAYKVRQVSFIDILPHPLADHQGDLAHPFENEPIPSHVLQKSGTSTGEAIADEPITETITKITTSSDRRLYLTGVVIYQDIFEIERRTKFCYFLERTVKPVRIHQKGGTLHRFEWMLSHVHNDAT